jgi:hypothetical protein
MPVRPWTLVAPCLALALPAGAAPPGEGEKQIHGGLSTGVGLAYDGLGIRGEIGTDHGGLFVGIGLLGRLESNTLTADGPLGFSAGYRWYSGIRQGVFVSLNFTHTWWSDYLSFDDQFAHGRIAPGRFTTATVTAGYRWRFGVGFFEAAVGGGAYRHQDTGSSNAATPPPTVPQPPPTYGVLPDVALGVGFDL